MNEEETIEFVERMKATEKATVYMRFYVDMLYSRLTNKYGEIEVGYWQNQGLPDPPIKTFEEFCDKSNIQINDTGIEDWKDRGFATKSWIVLRTGSIYHYVYHKL